MDKMAMISKMTDSIKADPALDVSEWKTTLHFKAGALEKMTLEDSNAIEIEGMPELKEGELISFSLVSIMNFLLISSFLKFSRIHFPASCSS